MRYPILVYCGRKALASLLLAINTLLLSGCCAVGHRWDYSVDGWKGSDGKFYPDVGLPKNISDIEAQCKVERDVFYLAAKDRWCSKAEKTGNYKEPIPEYGVVLIEEKMRDYCKNRPPIPEKWQLQKPRDIDSCMKDHGYERDRHTDWECRTSWRLF